jgi:hypothetical protein
MVRTSASLLLKLLVLLSIAVGICEAYLFGHDAMPDVRAETLWALTFSLILAMWVEADSRARPEIYRPYNIGFFAFFFWFAYAPYYLIRTRRARGAFWLLGLVALYFLGFFLTLAATLFS